jgi:outer membrane protein
MTDQTAEKTKPDLNKPKKKKLTLEAAINQALEANRGIRDVIDQVEGARLSLFAVESEFELKIIPAGEARITGDSDEGSTDSLGAGISLQKKFDVGTDIIITPKTRKTDDIYNTGVDTRLIQPLLRGFGKEYNLSGVHSAEFGTRTARRNLYLRQVSTVLLTINAVYDVVRQRELYRLNEESALRLQVHAEAANAKNKIGMANQIDVYRAGIQQKQAEDNLNTAREAYSAALDNLKILLSLPLDEEIEVEAPLNYNLVRMAKEQATNTALKNRVELDQAKDSIREAERLSRVAKHNIWPDFDVVLNYSRFGSGENFGNSTGFNQDSWNLGLVTSTDLARTVERAAYDQSLLNVKGSQRNYNLLRDEVIREVNLGFRNLRSYENSIAIQEEQIRQAKGQLELAQVKFKWGLANNFDLIDAETKLSSAQTNLLSAVLNYIVGTNRFRASMGTLLERPKKF